MQHLDPDRLVLLALSEDPEDPGESVHLTDCASCRADLAALRTVAEICAESEELRDLPEPPERVWHGIQGEINFPTSRYAVEFADDRHRRHRRWSPVLLASGAAAVAAVVAVAATLGITWLVRREPEPRVTARAVLSALPSVPSAAHGSVRVLADGRMRVDVRDLPLTTGYHQVWLIDPTDTARMVSVGNLGDGPDALLRPPPGTDLHRYRLVDVSDEPLDGNTAHSGHSLLRGVLTS